MPTNPSEAALLILRRVFYNRQRRIRAPWLIVSYAALSAALSVVVLSAFHKAGDMLGWGGAAPLVAELPLLAGAILAAILLLRIVHKQPARILGFAFHNRIGIEIVQGAALGAAMVALFFVLEWAAGWADIRWAATPADIAGLLALYNLTFLAISAAFEEALMRGYAFQILVQSIGKAAAVCLTSCAFGLAHIANPNVGFLGILNAVLAGVWLSIAYLKTRSLWLPTALHLSWNTTAGVIFGYPVSGEPFPSVFKLTRSGKDWITGGDYGLEGGALCLAVLALGLIIIAQSKWIHPSPKAAALWE